MEMLLNLSWALCSLGLVWIWIRHAESNPVRRRTQLLALAMVVLLLLPVISLSDDLVAAQGPAETDTCLRRALPSDQTHPSVKPAYLAMPEQETLTLTVSSISQEALSDLDVPSPSSSLPRSLASRAPPQG
jgi:hypothetical protein